MKPVARPNAWVAVEDDPATQLTYAPRVDPAPLTVSVPGRDPKLGSLVVVITNQTPAPVAVSSITFTVTVGQTGVQGTPLMPTTADSHALVSDTTTWSLAWPQQPVTSGTVDCALTPATGSTATLAAGASVYVEIYNFHTVEVPSTSTVLVTETIGNSDPSFTNINVSTFPDGFFFDSLTVNVGSPGALVPVAQVVKGSGVTLTWNSSLVDTKKQTVYWSSPTDGQQHAIPIKLGEWSTPANQPLTSDTVFVVVVEAVGAGDEPLPASLATAVSVQNPALVASSASLDGELKAGSAKITTALTAGTATVNGAVGADTAGVKGELTAGSAKITDALTAGTATVNGALTAGATTVHGNLSAGTASVDGHVGAGSATVNGEVQAGSVTTGTAKVTSNLDVRGATVSLLGAAQLLPAFGTYTAKADSLVIVTTPSPPSYPPPQYGYYVTGKCGATTMFASAGSWTTFNGQAILLNSSFVLPVAAGQQFTLAVNAYAYGAQVALSFIPLGALPKQGPAFEQVAEAGPPDRAIEDALADAVAQRERETGEFVALLEEAIGKPIGDGLKQQLVATLRGR